MKNLCKILLFYNIFLVTENDNRFAPGTESNGNPWDNPNRKEEEPYQMKVISNSMTAAIQGEEKQKGMAAGVVVKTIIALIVCGALIFGGKAIVSVVMPEGEDITDLLKNDAAAIASQLGVTFTDNNEWVSQIHQYSKGTATVKAAEDIGIVYIDGKQMGVHVRSKKYTMFGVQLGDSETSAYNGMSFPYDNFL